MKTWIQTTLIGVALAGVLAVAGACSDDRNGFAQENPAFTDPDAGSASLDGAPTTCGFRCSRDLKKVLKGCSGTATEDDVVAECPVGQGCGIDKCVPACDSAALSKGSTGCAFFALPPDDGHYGAGACFAAMIANTWDVPVNVTAEYGGEALDISQSIYTVTRSVGGDVPPQYTKVTGPLAPGQVAVIFLAQAENLLDPDAPLCPPGTTAALHVDPLRHGTAKTKAFHLKTDAPVAAYSIFPYGGATSMYPTATLLLPVSSWEKSYLAVSPAHFGNPEVGGALDRRTLQIIASEDDTTVSMRPNVNIGSGLDVEQAAENEVAQWKLARRGQVLQITQQRAPSGSPVVADKPIGIFGGSPCTFIPTEKAYCDLTQQQITPFAQWGTSYALVPYRPRVEGVTTKDVRETVPWSLVGAADGTVLTYEPSKPPGAPSTLAAGEVFTFQTDALVSVRSQDSKHPFHASVYMTGSTNGGGSPSGGRTLGDPDFVNIVPTDQFLDRYVFFTDYTYPETNLTVVRKKTALGFRTVKLECGGEITNFQPLTSDLEYAWVRLTTGYVPQKLPGGNDRECGYGRHEATSDGPFSVTVWGIGKDASYGYAAGMGSRPINDAPIPIVQ